jgi:hypothetical protein
MRVHTRCFMWLRRTYGFALTRMHACTQVRTHARTHARTRARAPTHTHTRTQARTHACTHARTHARTHAARTHARTQHARTHARSTHARTHTQTRADAPDDARGVLTAPQSSDSPAARSTWRIQQRPCRGPSCLYARTPCPWRSRVAAHQPTQPPALRTRNAQQPLTHLRSRATVRGTARAL